jgi:hypothetical protein
MCEIRRTSEGHELVLYAPAKDEQGVQKTGCLSKQTYKIRDSDLERNFWRAFIKASIEERVDFRKYIEDYFTDKKIEEIPLQKGGPLLVRTLHAWIADALGDERKVLEESLKKRAAEKLAGSGQRAGASHREMDELKQHAEKILSPPTLKHRLVKKMAELPSSTAKISRFIKSSFAKMRLWTKTSTSTPLDASLEKRGDTRFSRSATPTSLKCLDVGG